MNSDAFFPDAWGSTVGELRRLVRRVMKYAGLRDLDVEIAVEDEVAPESKYELDAKPSGETRTASCHVSNVDKGRCVMRVTEPLPEPPELVAEIAREAARAYRARQGLPHLADSEDDERLLDVTATYLGLGALAASAPTARLSPQEVGFLFGVRSIVRYDDAERRRTTAAQLQPAPA